MKQVLHYQAFAYCPEPTNFAAAETTSVDKWVGVTNQLPLQRFKRRHPPGSSQGPLEFSVLPELLDVARWTQPTNQLPPRRRRPHPLGTSQIVIWPVIPDPALLGLQQPQAPEVPRKHKRHHVGQWDFAPPDQTTWEPPVDRWFRGQYPDAPKKPKRYHVSTSLFVPPEQSLYQAVNVSQFWFQYGDFPRKKKQHPMAGCSLFYCHPQTDVVTNPLAATDPEVYRRVSDAEPTYRRVTDPEDE